MLINPRLNNLMNKTLAGMAKGSKNVDKAALKKLSEFMKKEYPDEGDWDKLSSS